jgi:hypothetical protein
MQKRLNLVPFWSVPYCRHIAVPTHLVGEDPDPVCKAMWSVIENSPCIMLMATRSTPSQDYLRIILSG